MTGHRPFQVPDQPIACPFCGAAIGWQQRHSCPEMREHGATLHVGAAPINEPLGYLPRIGMALVIGLALLLVMYLGAYVLRSLGVGC